MYNVRSRPSVSLGNNSTSGTSLCRRLPRAYGTRTKCIIIYDGINRIVAGTDKIQKKKKKCIKDNDGGDREASSRPKPRSAGTVRTVLKKTGEPRNRNVFELSAWVAGKEPGQPSKR